MLNLFSEREVLIWHASSHSVSTLLHKRVVGIWASNERTSLSLGLRLNLLDWLLNLLWRNFNHLRLLLRLDRLLLNFLDYRRRVYVLGCLNHLLHFWDVLVDNLLDLLHQSTDRSLSYGHLIQFNHLMMVIITRVSVHDLNHLLGRSIDRHRLMLVFL